jgi:hypothetical protein
MLLKISQYHSRLGPYSHLLASLIAIEVESSSRALKDDRRAESAQNAGLVVLRRVQLSDNSIIRTGELCVARWTASSVGMGVGQAQGIRTGEAEDM